jgi:predicted CopG family antitoxin
MILCKICKVYIPAAIIMEMMAKKTIAISKDNYELLKNYGRAGDTFNDVITNLIKKRRPQSDSRHGNRRLTASSTSTIESNRSKGDVPYE